METALRNLFWNFSGTSNKILIALKPLLACSSTYSKVYSKAYSKTNRKLLWNCSETALKLLWNCSETALKLLWNCSETFLKLLWNCSETCLYQALTTSKFWASETALELEWNCAESALKLKLMLNSAGWNIWGRDCHSLQWSFPTVVGPERMWCDSRFHAVLMHFSCCYCCCVVVGFLHSSYFFLRVPQRSETTSAFSTLALFKCNKPSLWGPGNRIDTLAKDHQNQPSTRS